MTEPELMNERRHIYETRLAILEASNPPSAEHHNIAVAEADEHIRQLRNQQETETDRRFRQMRESL